LRTQIEVQTALATEAFERGEALRMAGDPAGARPWLERASRIATDDDTIGLSLGLVLLSLGDAGAAGLLERIAGRHDLQPIWLGLAMALLRQGRAEEAAAALAAALSRHSLTNAAAVSALAREIALRVGAPGWCGLQRDFSLTLVLIAGAGGPQPVIEADGVDLGRRRVPQTARRVAVTQAGTHLLGSPIHADRLRRVEGCVVVQEGGLAGWAWHPADIACDPVLEIVPLLGGKRRQLVASDANLPPHRPLARPRGFVVTAGALADISGPLSVRGPDGTELAGSPLDPGLERRAAAAAAAAVARALPVEGRTRRLPLPWLPTPAGLAGAPANASCDPERPLAVVVPVYRGQAVTLGCLEAVFATAPPGTTVIVVDDASPEPDLAAALNALAAAGKVRLLRHATNRGFPAAVNTGLRDAARLPGGPDIVLLNSDTVPAPGWLAGLRRVVQASGDIGTASPLSNDATILTYPDPRRPAAAPDAPALAGFGALAAATHPETTVDIPTAVGFCMYIRRECLEQTGLLREDVFAQGYGEENDFCLRAQHLGWRHVAVPGAYVAHLGGQSFGDVRTALLARNLDVLERLHPGYGALIAAWQRADPLAPARRALDAARWACRLPPQSAGAVVLVTHDHQGGVERAVRARCAALAAEGLRPIVLRPVPDVSESAVPGRHYVPDLVEVADGPENAFPNLRFRLPDELASLADLLRPERPRRLELHHLKGHNHAVVELAERLDIPFEVRVHDYGWFCPRINLVGPEGRYCGEPDVAACEACVADSGSELEEAIGPAALRTRSAADLARAARIVTPSRDAAARLRRHFPTVRPEVEPHESDADLPPLRPLPPPPRRVGVIGAIGVAKGYQVLLDAARDAARRDLPLSYVVIGHSHDDARLLATGRVFITGPYREEDAATLLRAQNVHLAWLPSIWPETWCYALGHALRDGLAVIAFDIGAQAERIRATGRGRLLPLGLPPAAINNAILALQTTASDVWPRQS
jgi:GT2 family glycosyltransferase/glycosyltransferase involved in cell wall biosynthesis